MKRAWTFLGFVCLGILVLGTGTAYGQQMGSIVAWGYNGDGQCYVPAPNADFIALAAGAWHSLGLKSNGSIVAWGFNGVGECNVPLPNTDFVAVAAGVQQSLGLKSDGTIVAWGMAVIWPVPSPNTDFVAVATGAWHSLGLKSDGSIVAWGWNNYGECDVPAPNADFIAVAAGTAHSLGLKSDGTIVAWGWNSSGQCNVPAPNAGFIAVAAGSSHSLGLKSDGSIASWGDNTQGQCNVPAPNADFVGVAAGGSHSLGLKTDGSIVAWGFNNRGQCDVPAPNAGFIAIAGGGEHSLGLRQAPPGSCAVPEVVSYDPVLVNPVNCPGDCTVNFTVGTIGDYSGVQKITLEASLSGVWVEEDSIPAPIGDPNWTLSCDVGEQYPDGPHAFRVVFHCGASKSYSFPVILSVMHGESIMGWGQVGSGLCDVLEPNADFVGVALGVGHSLGLKSDGTIIAWGDNNYGQCNVPAPNEGFVAVAAGASHSLGLKSDGTIVAWGRNNYGQCNVPVPNANFVGLASGWSYSLGLRSDRSVVAWGWNINGECDVPFPNADFVAVAACANHNLGLKANGMIVAWGSHGGGVPPLPNADFVAVAAGDDHSLGLKSDGTIVAWGDNYYSQCNVPAPNANFVAVAAGGDQSLGLKLHGTIAAWGSGAEVRPPDGDFVAIAAGGNRCLGLGHSSCAFPEIASPNPVQVNPDICPGGCVVSFTVGTACDYSGVQKITLERNLLGTWVQVDSIPAPVGDPDWTLTCEVDEQYPDGRHTFCAVFQCEDGSRTYSLPAVLTVSREISVPVLFSGFEAEHANGGVLLRWKIVDGAQLQGFNIYRSLEQDARFERVNEKLIPSVQGNEYIDRGAGFGNTYWYRLGAVADDGEWMSQTVSITVPKPVLALHQNQPNPFNPTTTISFTLPERAKVTLAIYDVKGRLVRTLVDEMVGEGNQERIWDGRDASGNPVGSGVYFCRLIAGDKTLTMKMVLLK